MDKHVDIRRICKIFCDFIYNNHILPIEIENILCSDEDCKWDVRQLVSILSYNKDYKASGNNKIEKQIEYISSKVTFNSNYIKGKIISSHLENISKSLNNYFHNVSVRTITDYIIVGIRNYIQELADKEAIRKEIADEYISKINDVCPVRISAGDKPTVISTGGKLTDSGRGKSKDSDFRIAKDLVVPYVIPVLEQLSDVEFNYYVDNVTNSNMDFYTGRYPLLSLKKETYIDNTGRSRCWNSPMVNHNGRKYYMYSQWVIQYHYDIIIKWLRKHNVILPNVK